MKSEQRNDSAPRVSVVIPSYNCGTLLPAAIGSVLSQGESRVELIVIDDGSTDGSSEWLEQAGSNEPRLRVARQQQRGPGAARNLGISRASAPLVAFLDADDRWLPGKLRSQLDFHERNPEVAFSFTDYRHVGEDGSDLGGCFQYWPHFAPAAGHDTEFRLLAPHPATTIFAQNVVGTSTVMARRIALQNANGFDESLRSAQDWDLWIRLALRGKAGFTPQVLCAYQMRAGSVTSNLPLRLACMERVIARHEDAVSALDPAAFRHAAARLNTGRAEHHRREGAYLRAALRHLAASLQAPSRRSLRALAAALRDATPPLRGRSARRFPDG